MGNFSHRKFFNWRILHFCLRNKVDIESWVDTSTKSNKNIKTVVKNYQLIDKMDLFYFTIYQDQESNPSNKKGSHFDWMGLNEEILSHTILVPIGGIEEEALRLGINNTKTLLLMIPFLYRDRN
uniref:Uncharacterized protein n=1 Tax=Gossypium raimondii TaxID=29730 RepID=A0A0D2UPJ9_GOSRA|nr:hypothetical protein B456_011G078900 [Gossypium raimondii]